MRLFMTLACPHCPMVKAPIEVVYLHVVKRKISKASNATFDINCAGICGACKRMTVAGFRIGSTPESSLDSFDGDLCGDFTAQGYPGSAQLLFQGPEVAGPDIPEHLPATVERAFLDAEKSFHLGLWGPAAGAYRKAVDRAVTPLIGEGAKGKMLGPKIGMLERTNLLPPAMLDWIRIVKDDGNFALHDDDSDFDSREEVEPAREFARTLLTYLYTLPRKVHLARGEHVTPDAD